MTKPTSPSSSRRPIRLTLAAVLALLLIAGGAVAVSAATRGSTSTGTSHGFRTATVSRQSVRQSLDNVGVIEPVGQAAVAFPVAGKIDSVAVNVGDNVSVGQQLAGLDTTSLKASLAGDEAQLAAANLTLYQALNGETITGGGSGGTGSGSGGSGTGFTTGAVTSASAPIAATLDDAVVTTTTTPATTSTTTMPATTTTTVPAGGHHSGGSGSTSLAAAEQAVLADQRKVDADLAKAATDLATANQVCGTSGPTPPTPPGTTTTTTTTVPGSGGPGSAAACSAALAQELEDQQATAADQNALATASQALDKLINESAGTGSGSKTGGTGGKTTGSSGSRTGSGTGGRTGTSAARTSTPTAAQLVAYQAAVDTAELQVQVGVQAIAQATVVSPISGTVVADSMVVGDSVTAGSTSEDIVIQGAGGYEVSTTVSVDDISKVKVGQVADVVPDGVAQTIVGKVVSVGIAADTSGSTTTYPVVIGFDGSPAGLRNGATASVSIVIDQSATALAVPTSALTMAGSQYSVNLLVKGKSSSTDVEVGAIGPEYTAITSGLKLGQVVVLADLSAPLPSSATATATSTGTGTGRGAGGTGGTGRFGGGGGGGFGGGGGGFGGGGGTGRGG